jgi:16S rRNA processing protein RimM
VFITAIVQSPFGLEGFVKVKPLSGETEHLKRLKSVVLREKIAERRVEIEKIERNGSTLLIKFKHVDSPEAAKALCGAEILVERGNAAPLFENEYYIEDLKGLRVFDSDGKERGTVHDVLEGGGGQLVEICLPHGEFKFVPFRNEFFGEVSLERKEIKLLNCWILE